MIFTNKLIALGITTICLLNFGVYMLLFYLNQDDEVLVACMWTTIGVVFLYSFVAATCNCCQKEKDKGDTV